VDVEIGEGRTIPRTRSAVLVNRDIVLGYLKDLDAVFDLDSVGERQVILQSFGKVVQRGGNEVTPQFTIPLAPKIVKDYRAVVQKAALSGGPECTIRRTGPTFELRLSVLWPAS
jgi:hypothetical protein